MIVRKNVIHWDITDVVTVGNMNWIEIAGIILGGIISLAAIAALFGIAWSQFTQGKSQASMTNDGIYKERIEALELKVKSQSEDISSLTEQVKKLRTDNEEANRKLLEAMNILQNRNPDLVEFLKKGNEYMLSTAPVVDTLKRFLDKQII